MKKCSYKERKKPSRPSGSVPPALLASSRAETPSGVSQPGTSTSSVSRPSGGQGKREGSRGAPGVVSRGASSPPTGSRSGERGGSVSGLSSVAGERAPASPAPSGAGEGGVAQSQRTSLARSTSSVVSPYSSPHARRRGELRETSEDRSRVLSCRGSRSSDRGARKDKRARARSSSSRDRGHHSRSRSSSRSRSRGRERRRRSSSRSLSSRVRSQSSDRYHSRHMCSHSRGDRSRSSDRYRSRRDRSRSSDCYRSRRQRTRSPARRGGRGHAIDDLPPLTARGLGRKDG